MKLMIASDLHGSGYYVKKLVDAFQAEGAEKLLLLGDLLYHGPRNHLPEEYDCPTVAQQLNAMKDKIIAVRGNCDCEVDRCTGIPHHGGLRPGGVEWPDPFSPPTATATTRPARLLWRTVPFSSTATSTSPPALTTNGTPTSTPVPPLCPKAAAWAAISFWRTALSPGRTWTATPIRPIPSSDFLFTKNRRPDADASGLLLLFIMFRYRLSRPSQT